MHPGGSGCALSKSEALEQSSLCSASPKSSDTPPALSFCSHKSEEGQSVLEQPLPERAAFIRSFLQSKSLRRGARQPPPRFCQGSG